MEATAGMSRPLETDALERLKPLIELELHRRIGKAPASVRLPMSDVLKEIFAHLCGGQRSGDDHIRFLAFAAPLAREAVMQRLSREQQDRERLKAFDVWFHRVQSFDPLCTRMIDLF